MRLRYVVFPVVHLLDDIRPGCMTGCGRNVTAGMHWTVIVKRVSCLQCRKILSKNEEK